MTVPSLAQAQCRVAECIVTFLLRVSVQGAAVADLPHRFVATDDDEDAAVAADDDAPDAAAARTPQAHPLELVLHCAAVDADHSTADLDSR